MGTQFQMCRPIKKGGVKQFAMKTEFFDSIIGFVESAKYRVSISLEKTTEVVLNLYKENYLHSQEMILNLKVTPLLNISVNYSIEKCTRDDIRFVTKV